MGEPRISTVSKCWPFVILLSSKCSLFDHICLNRWRSFFKSGCNKFMRVHVWSDKCRCCIEFRYEQRHWQVQICTIYAKSWISSARIFISVRKSVGITYNNIRKYWPNFMCIDILRKPTLFQNYLKKVINK